MKKRSFIARLTDIHPSGKDKQLWVFEFMYDDGRTTICPWTKEKKLVKKAEKLLFKPCRATVLMTEEYGWHDKLISLTRVTEQKLAEAEENY